MDDNDQPLRRAGWAWPGLAKKPHYFTLGSITSLCGSWMFGGERGGPYAGDACVLCTKRLAKATDAKEAARG